MADQAGGIIEVHGLEVARNLLRRPAPMDQLAPHPVVQPTPLSEFASPSAALAPRPISGTGQLRAVKLRRQRFQSAPPQFPTDHLAARPSNPPISRRLAPR